VAWWLCAAGGAVLIVVDIQTHRLPARFTYPLTIAVVTALAGAAVLHADPAALARAGLAAAVVGGGYLAVRFISPAALGQGDVRTAVLAAAVAGSTGWASVGQAQLLTAVLGAATAVILRCRPTAQARRTGQIPLGPAIITAALLTAWL
jgi:leader peptidase (prepilin peptidase)/N-methyltransferase